MRFVYNQNQDICNILTIYCFIEQITDFLAELVDGTTKMLSGNPIETPDSILKLKVLLFVRSHWWTEEVFVSADCYIFFGVVHYDLTLVV